MNNFGKLLQGAAQAQQIIPTVLHDAQLLALVASSCSHASPADAVEWAQEVIARSCLGHGKLLALINELQREEAAPDGD